MSYWVSLKDENRNNVIVDSHSEGGTYAIGGINDADLNVTYNYSGDFVRAWPEDLDKRKKAGDGLLGKMLHGRKAGDVIELLEKAVEKLGTDRHPDYWAPTPGNAGYALSILLTWARQHPNAVFHVS